MTEPAAPTTSTTGTNTNPSPPASDQQRQRPKPQKQNQPRQNQGGNGHSNNSRGKGGTKPRGLERDTPEVRLSKTLSWILRHRASSEGIVMRKDGFVKVDDILRNGRIQSLGLTLDQLKDIVQADSKQRYTLVHERSDGTSVASSAVAGDGAGEGVWLIRANQGHSISTVKVEMKPILSLDDIPSKLAVHGTTREAWDSIQKQGLSKMMRNHIHLAQGVGGDNVISGMRRSSQILVFVNVQKALDAGIKFELSDNGVVLTGGDEKGFLRPQFFDRVEDAKTRQALAGWEGRGAIDNKAVAMGSTVS
ncbi:tRNA 2'-phosphotransferase 1 [Leucoagaricus sp. SymC.cos]|nr:tRNA 2'-phosphotransferase 1 [Leucoagaricus sp. SymC.cos]